MEFLNECPQVILTPQRLRAAWFLDELMDQHYRGWDDGFRWLLPRPPPSLRLSEVSC